MEQLVIYLTSLLPLLLLVPRIGNECSEKTGFLLPECTGARLKCSVCPAAGYIIFPADDGLTSSSEALDTPSHLWDPICVFLLLWGCTHFRM
jgi:hypothetical protein